MELSTTFRRRVGAVSTDPVLGSDVLPTGLPNVGDAVDNLGIVARCIHSTVMDNPVQRIALFYHYTGVGPAPAVVVTPYCYVRETNSWYQLGIAVTLTADSVGFIDSIAGILPMRTMQPMDTGDTLDSLEVCLLAALPAGAPNGLYDFGAVFDSSLDGSNSERSGAAVLAELALIYARQAAVLAANGGGSLYVESAALEKMHQLKATAGQHNSTQVYNSGVPLLYLVIVDQVAAPTTAVTACRPLCGVPGGGAVLCVSKRTFAAGGWLCLSTNQTTYTDPGAVGWFVVQGD
jgi:hypothetical protein